MVPKLFDSCLQIVATNVYHVESLIGFPDIVGKQVFHAVKAAGKFDLDSLTESQYAVSLFASAYTDQFLSALNIDGEHLMLANCFEHLILFSHLKALDVSACGLGDEHELLYHIATLPSLEVLSLRGNSLTDKGIQKWTTPVRVKKTGPTGLKILDLSENENISARSLRFLHVFCNLQLLNLSSTVIQQRQSQELRDFGERRSLLVKTSLTEKQCANLTDILQVTTQGWAKEIIYRWIQHSRETSNQKNQLPISSGPKASRFYGRAVKENQLKTSNSAPPRSKRLRESSHLSLVLVNHGLISGKVASAPFSCREPGALNSQSRGLLSSQSTAESSGQSSRLNVQCGAPCWSSKRIDVHQCVNPSGALSLASLTEANMDCVGDERKGKTSLDETCGEKSHPSLAEGSLGVCRTKKQQRDLCRGVSNVGSDCRKVCKKSGEENPVVLCDRGLSEEEALLLSQYAKV
ncbi:leucine-rich repeat-containing protein 42-like [Littorina saxatilis]|uniref:Leucine-rich repeat-containing protein 42 n=1 Tax=Littorina saxatilis TaxID=31220 RepID=A0AAN9B7M1_9CAEN